METIAEFSRSTPAGLLMLPASIALKRRVAIHVRRCYPFSPSAKM
jgi:hypothetical protein